MKASACLFASAVAAVCWSAAGDVSLNGIFSDHMVLQHGKPIVVHGHGDRVGEHVRVDFHGASSGTKVDSRLRWSVELPPMPVSTNGAELVVRASNVLKVSDVLVGDVWLVSGQSNSEMAFSWGVIGSERVVAESVNYPNIRFVKFSHERSVFPETEPICSPWRLTTDSKLLLRLTAIGYYFAREINARTGIPIGLVDDNWSGCRIEPFIPLEGLAAVAALSNDFAKASEQARKLAAPEGLAFFRTVQNRYLEWSREIEKARKRGEDRGFSPPVWNAYNTELCGQYNAMISPIVTYPICGALWYQGCSNGGEGSSYMRKLEALIGGWRKKWGYDFPFYIVQLSSFAEKTTDPAGGNGYAPTRDAQRLASVSVPGCGLVVTIDIGNAKDIHPKNKYDVGYRLSLWARRDVYGERGLVVSGPLFKELKIEGGKARVVFDHVGSGLFAGEKGPDTPGEMPTATPDGKLRGFSVAGADRIWHWADAVIDGADVVVSAKEVPAPVAVRYAYRMNPMGDCNLYNREGLPASPFRTDTW